MEGSPKPSKARQWLASLVSRRKSVEKKTRHSLSSSVSPTHPQVPPIKLEALMMSPRPLEPKKTIIEEYEWDKCTKDTEEKPPSDNDSDDTSNVTITSVSDRSEDFTPVLIRTSHSGSLVLKKSPGTSSSSSSSSGRLKERRGSILLSYRDASYTIPMVIDIDPKCPHASFSNPDGTGKRFNLLLKNGPDADDGDGFVYLSRFERDSDNIYFHVSYHGLSGGKCSHLLPVKRKKFATKLVRLLLEGMAILRYPVATDHSGRDVHVSIQKSTRAILFDTSYQYLSDRQISIRSAISGKHAKRGWFRLSEDVLVLVAGRVINAVNTYWKNEQWAQEVAALGNLTNP